ncbi:MAG TPA: hypothetical protein VND41_05715 [Nitrososphaerales archaeon]|nr:hypothetical protein [Nitrososphaerales archaeon]
MSPFSGDTCAGRARIAATLSLLGLLLGLLLAAVPLQPGLAGTASAAANSPGSAPSLSLGFSPSSLSPVSGGIPVYTTGETIWAESAYNYSVTLSLTSAPLPDGAPGAVVATKPLDPAAVTPLYTFTPADTDGVWNITLASTQGSAVIPVRFVNLVNDRPVSLGPIEYSLEGANLSISAQANLGNSYDQEVCAAGSTPEPPVTLSLPRDMGDLGSIALTPGNPFGITVLGVLNKPLSFWFELYHPYALDTTATSNLVADNLMAAQSQPFDVVSNGPANTVLTWNTPLRAGRYDLRTFFQNSTSLEVFQSRVLILNDSSWISLSSTCLPHTIQSSDVSYSANLTSGQADWPRTLYVMYRTFGVEAVNSYPVRANLSSVNFIASPWGKPLQDGKVSVSPSGGVLQTSQEGGSLFVLASQYPFRLNYSLDIGAQVALTQGSVTVEGSYSTQNIEVSTAELNVHVLGEQSSPITLEVTGSQGASITAATVERNQTVSLFLPAGSYTVTALQAGGSESAKVGLTDGLASAVTLNFNAIPSLEIILVVTAAIAAVANVIVWSSRRRSVSSRLARHSKE